MSDKNALVYVDTISNGEISAHLEKLARGFRLGVVGIEGQGQELTLRPTPPVKIELTAGTQKGTGELKFEISWQDARRAESERLRIIPGTDNGEADTGQSVDPPDDAPAAA